MYVDIINIFGLHFSIFQCALHNKFCAKTLGVRGRNMVCVSTHANTGHFAVDVCAASQGVVERLQHEDTCTLSHNESVAALRERTACVLGVIVASGERVHSVEASKAARPDSSFCTASYNSVGFAQTQEVERVSQGVGCAGAGARRCIVRAAEAVVDRDLSGSDVGNHLRDEERVELRALSFMQCVVAGLFFKRVDTTDADA